MSLCPGAADERHIKSLAEGAGLLCEVAVAVCDPIGSVRPPAEGHAVVVNRDVRVVVLRLGEVADAVHERECRNEVLELERTLESAVDLAPSLGGHGDSIYDRRQRMTISTENAPAPLLVPVQHERRAGHELVLELVFRPLASALVPLFLRARISPPAVVLANAATGLCAAFALARGELVLAVVLLQVKTLLDNADGQLARTSGKVTLTGRYLDTEADLVVNAALFVALGHVTGQPWLALAAFLALTLVLTVDFNVTELYREGRGEAKRPLLASGGHIERVLGRFYRVVFAPQDRLLRSFSAIRLERALARKTPSEAVTRAYHDRVTVTVLANLGLSTQLVVLGLCLLLDAPAVYLWLVLGCLALLPVLQLRREHLARRALAR